MKKFILILVLFVSSDLFPQSAVYAPVYDVLQNNPKSPNVNALFKFKEIPVNASSGIPNIEIPIYTIQSGDIKIPISLRYNGGGIKVDELPTSVGLGWSLSVGGVISQKVNGLDDFLGVEGDLYDVGTYVSPMYGSVSIIQSQTINSMTDFFAFQQNAIASGNNYALTESRRFLGRVADGWFDAEADEFHFTTPTGTGSVFFDQSSGVFKSSNIDNWIILEHPSSGFNQGKWVLQDPNGIQYYFEKKEMSQSPLVNNINARPCRTPENCDKATTPVKYPQLISTWFLSEVKSLRKNNSVNLSYNTAWRHYSGGFSFRAEFNTSGVYVGGTNGEVVMRDGEENTINEIYFPEGKVKFIYSSTLPNDDGPSALEYIKIYNSKNQEKEVYKLIYQTINPVGNNGNPDLAKHILFLKEVEQSALTEQSQKLYEFGYNLQTRFPKRFLFAQDEWGYYNGNDNNVVLTP